MIIFATKKYETLKRQMLATGRFGKEADGLLERKTFADGETYLRIKSPVRHQDIMILGGTIDDTDMMEIYDLGCALAKSEARTICFVIPFYGYSTMERAEPESGEVVKAKTRARLLSAVPQAYQGNTVYLLDLHAEGMVHYFEGDIKTHHMSAKSCILSHIKNLNLKDFVIASADQGRAKQIQKLADILEVDSAFISKRRYNDGRVVAQAANSDVSGRTVIIYDDMIRTASSIVEAIKTYEAAGAKEIYLYTTHGVFCSPVKGGVKGECPKVSLSNLKIVKKVIYTNSHPQLHDPADLGSQVRPDLFEEIDISEHLTEELLGK